MPDPEDASAAPEPSPAKAAEKPPTAATDKLSREDRLARALRDNLRRRKASAKKDKA